MCHSRADEPTVSDPQILVTAGEYDVSINQLFDCAGLSSANSAFSCESNAPPEPTPHSPSQLSSTCSIFQVEHPMATSELSGPRKEKSDFFEGKFHVPNPLAHIYMPVLSSSGQVSLVAAECKPDISQSAKSIFDGTGRDEDISLDLSMGFPTSPLVGVHTRDYSIGDQIFPGMLPYEQVRKHYIIKIFLGRRLMMTPS